jgi:hypothetical protein
MVLGMALKSLRFELDPGAPSVVEHLTFTMGPQALPMRFARR